MKFKYSLLLLLTLITASQSFGQQHFTVPANYQLNAKEDYAKYEKDIIEAISWLENTPLNKEEEKRREISTFVLKWITGSPNVSIEFNNYVTDLSAKNPELLVIFLAGWTKYALQHPEEKDIVKLNAEGVQAMLRVYRKGGAVKDKKLEKLLDILEKQGLEQWVKRKIA